MFRHPAQVVVTAFLVADIVGTLLLLLPVSRADVGSAPFITALFTATSAVCVTGLATVDTATYWSTTGQAIILALIQVGGFGIMTLASLIALFLSRRMGLRTRLTAAAETKAIGPGDVRRVLRGVFLITVVVEATIAVMLTLRFRAEYDGSWATATWHGVFHAVSAFNNAGFALFSDNFMGFLTDPFVLLPITLAIIIGGLGFPVLVELLAGRWTHVVQADSTDIQAMEQLGVGEFSKAVIGIGHNLEASVLTAFVLRKLGVSDIWAKAITTSQGEILEQVGVSHVVRPEHAMGKRVAHLVRGRMLDYIEFDDGYAIVKTTPPHGILGKTLADAGVRSRYGVTIVGIKSPGQDFSYATPTSVVNEGDLIIVSGDRRKVELFSDQE